MGPFAIIELAYLTPWDVRVITNREVPPLLQSVLNAFGDNPHRRLSAFQLAQAIGYSFPAELEKELTGAGIKPGKDGLYGRVEILSAFE